MKLLFIGCIMAMSQLLYAQKTASVVYKDIDSTQLTLKVFYPNAERFHIDSARIIASGGSAGGHLAAVTALIHDYSDVNDDLSISSKPRALILFNPVINNGPFGYGYDRIGDQYKKFSPMSNITIGAPPTIIFFGENII